jgi:tRNA threonylcarbamoyl adenosine modification protein YjeE
VTSLQQLIGREAPRAPDRDSLEAWGRALGAALPRPAVVTFSGELGAGKTTLVRAVCEGLGVTDASLVTSPTFALIQEYPAPSGAIVHADLYRLRTDAELEGLGWDEIVATASVLLVEWPERAADTLPPGTISVELNHDPDHAERRRLSVKQQP